MHILDRSSIPDIQKDNNARYIINNIFLTLPRLECSTHKILSSTLRVALQEEGVDDVSDLLILKELPDTITRQNNDFIS